jgi:hypothetical protein
MYCSVCAPSPPPIALCSNCMCYSLFLEFGGEMLIDLTFSLSVHLPLALRTYMGLFTFSHYPHPPVSRQYSSYSLCKQLLANIMPIFVHFCEHFRAVYHYFLCVQIFSFKFTLFSNLQVFRIFANIITKTLCLVTICPPPVHVM